MLDRKILTNISSLFSIKFSGYIIPLITLPYIVRVLGPEGFGYLVLSQAIVQYFVLAVNYGFDLSATQKVAKTDDKHELSQIFWNVFASKVTISLLGFIILLFVLFIIDDTEQIKDILIFSYLTVFASAIFPQWLFQGKEELGYISIVRVITQLLNIPLIFALVKGKEDLWLAALIATLPMMGIAVVSMWRIFNKKWVKWVKPSTKAMLVELKDGWHIFISSAAVNVYTTSVTVVIGAVCGPVSVAVFASANKILKAIQGLYTPVSNSFYPRINTLLEKDIEKANKLIIYLLKIQSFITLFLSLLLFIMAPYIVDIVFGEGYERTAVVLRIVSLVPFLTGLSNIFGVQILLSYGYKADFSKVLIVSAMLSAIILVPLCYLYDAEGAAVSILITESIVTLLMLRKIIVKRLPVVEYMRYGKYEI